MPEALAISQFEFARQAAARFEGKSISVRLATKAGALGNNSTVAAWDAAEASGGGYARSAGTLGTGSWNGTLLQYEVPIFNAQYLASGGGFSHDTVYVVVDGGTYPQSVITFPAPIVLTAGQPLIYPIRIILKA